MNERARMKRNNLSTEAVALGITMVVCNVALAEVWTRSPSAPRKYWQSVAASADGRKLVAVVPMEVIYTSSDSGVSWTPSTGPVEAWQSVASSADGDRLVAVVSMDISG